MLAYRGFVRSNIDAVDRVVGDVALQPLDLRTMLEAVIGTAMRPKTLTGLVMVPRQEITPNAGNHSIGIALVP
jgi:hypothetical protein